MIEKEWQYYFWFNILCIWGIADLASLSVFDFCTKYFSRCLVLLSDGFTGNMSLVLGFLRHLFANLIHRSSLLSFNVFSWVRYRKI